MSSQFLVAERTPTSLLFTVWLDTTKTVGKANAYTFTPAGGSEPVNPDPAWVRAWSWGAQAPDGWTGASLNGAAYAADQWADYVTAEVELLARAVYAQLTADPTALAVQGTTF